MGAGVVRRTAGLGLGAVLFAAPAHAAAFSALMDDPLALIASFGAVGVFSWSVYAVRRMLREEIINRRRIAELEVRLNEAEAAISAECNVLVIWQGRDSAPERVIGSMHGAAQVPKDADALLDFRSWLEHDSAEALSHAVRAMRHAGTPFNIGVRSKINELLEADGRTAGPFATLRFRPLAGERRDITELASDAFKLGKQVERLSAVLDSAPLPIWLRTAQGKLAWVNKADLFRVKGIGTQYADLLEKAGVDTVVELGKRKPENLLEKMKQTNEEKKLVRQLPTLKKVQDWVEQAKALPRAVTY
jgi:PAS domain-containing protein